MTSRPDQRPAPTRPSILAAGAYTGWWDQTGPARTLAGDFLDPDSEWRPDIKLVTHEPDEQPF